MSVEERRDIAWGIELTAGQDQRWNDACEAWQEALNSLHGPDQRCSICRSFDRAVAAGWPVCANRYFHEPRLHGWAAYRYRGAHRPGPGRRTVEELEIELRPPSSPDPIYLGTQTLPFNFYGIAPDPTPEVITATMTFESDPSWVLGVPALMGPMPPQPVLTFEGGQLLADGQPISLLAEGDSTGSAAVPSTVDPFNPALVLNLRRADCSGSCCPDLYIDEEEEPCPF